MKYYAIIVAGGTGTRMQTAQAKQFLLLQDLPILMHTINAFYNCELHPEIVLVLHIDQHIYWEELCTKYQFTVPHQVVKGGEQRYHSVKNGLMLINEPAIVAIHDAVRPLVSGKLIVASFKAAEAKGNAVAAIRPVDSIRIKQAEATRAINRDEVYLIQTPQTFQVLQLKKAYEQAYRSEFTDDAAVVEQAGYTIALIDGERENMKITYPLDLELANLLVQKKGSC
jgi:2-C-methyl-D-erythritol 4-phosphate cytidylyltransferase